MRILATGIVLVLLLVAYGVYWFWAADRVETLVRAWAERENARGNEVRWQDLRVHGFPYRLQVTAERPVIEMAEFGWHGEKLTVHMLPYDFSHYIGIFEGEQFVRLGGSGAGRILTFRGRADTAKASLVFDQGVPERLSVDLENLQAEQTLDMDPRAIASPVATFRADRMQLHLRHLVNVPGEKTDEPGAAAALIENAHWPQHGFSGFGPDIALAKLQLTLTPFTAGAPGETAAVILRRWADDDGTLDLKNFDLKWEDVDLTLAGTLGLDAGGFVEGRLNAQVAGHDRIVESLSRERLMGPDDAETAKKVLDGLSMVSVDERGRLELPIKFEKGLLYVGPAEVARLQPMY